MKNQEKTKIKNILELNINSVTDEKGNYLPIDMFIYVDSWTDIVENWLKNTLKKAYKKEFGNQLKIKVNHQTTLHINTKYRKL